MRDSAARSGRLRRRILAFGDRNVLIAESSLKDAVMLVPKRTDGPRNISICKGLRPIFSRESAEPPRRRILAPRHRLRRPATTLRAAAPRAWARMRLRREGRVSFICEHPSRCLIHSMRAPCVSCGRAQSADRGVSLGWGSPFGVRERYSVATLLASAKMAPPCRRAAAHRSAWGENCGAGGARRAQAPTCGSFRLMLLLEVRLPDRPVKGPVIPDTALERPQLGAAEPVRVSLTEWLGER